MPRTKPRTGEAPHILVIGGGFAGVECVKQLRRTNVRVTLVDKHNHHLFQPLLYQVATAALSPANIAAPIREIFASDRHVHVMLDEVTGIDVPSKCARLASGAEIEADSVVLAAGLVPMYFGRDDWRDAAPSLKTIDDALEIRRRFLLAFETAELEDDPAAQQRNLTFVVIGGGPTGVEMAGALAELSRKTIRSEFRHIDPGSARILLVEGQDRLLPTMHPDSSRRALEDLERLGVEVSLSTRVESIDDASVALSDGRRIETVNAIWAAGVAGSKLAAETGGPLTRDGRVVVEPDLSIPENPDVFVVGDLAHVRHPRTGAEVPGVAPAAIQMGRYVGRLLRRETRARELGWPARDRRPFRYLDKGTLATIGRDKAVAEVFGRRFGGGVAYLLWALVHIYFLVGYRNRLLTFMQWVWHYVRYDRAARIITGGHRPKLAQPRRRTRTAA
jgi:NADH dehydrogenase